MADGSWGKILVTTIVAPIVVAVVGTQFSDVASDWFKSRKETPPPASSNPAAPAPAAQPERAVASAPSVSSASSEGRPAPPTTRPQAALTASPATPAIPAPAPTPPVSAAAPPTPANGADSARKAAELATRTAAAVAAMRNNRILSLTDGAKASVCGLEVGVEVYPQSGAGGSIVLLPPDGRPLRFSVGARNDLAPGCGVTLLNTMQDATTRAQVRETKAQ